MITAQFLPNILDVVLPLDEPRSRRPIIPAKYFMSQDEYFFTNILYEIVVIVISASIIFATASQLLIFCYHSFGMFKIARYQLYHCFNFIRS